MSDKEIEKSNQFELDKKEINCIMEEFIQSYEDRDEYFESLIRDYVDDCVQLRLRPFTFRKRLKQLQDAGLTAEQVVTVIETTEGNGWSKWDFSCVDTANNSTPSKNSKEVDMESKEKATEEFFRKHYFYQNPEIKEELLNYLHNCDNGRCVSAKDWVNKMEYLLLHCFQEDEMIKTIQSAIINNYPNLCIPDYERENRIKKTYGSLEHWVTSSDSYRRKYCEESRKRNPKDPRFEGMGLDWVEENKLKILSQIN